MSDKKNISVSILKEKYRTSGEETIIIEHINALLKSKICFDSKYENKSKQNDERKGTNFVNMFPDISIKSDINRGNPGRTYAWGIQL